MADGQQFPKTLGEGGTPRWVLSYRGDPAQVADGWMLRAPELPPLVPARKMPDVITVQGKKGTFMGIC